jgi:hypothetical protein
MIIYLALVAVGRPFQNEGSMAIQSLAILTLPRA